MTKIVVKTQRIVVNPATQSISIINAGPMGPTGAPGPSEASLVLLNDGDILTRVSGALAPITRSDLAASLADDIANDSALESKYALIDSVFGFTGQVIMWAGAALPTNWLECDGSTFLRSSPLFAVLGTTWGPGDGTTTANLPDLRGRAPIGVGTGSGLTARALASTTGAETVTLTAAQSGVPAHSHTLGSHTHGMQSHTHTGTSGTVSSDHVHGFSGNTGTVSAFHTHGGPSGGQIVGTNGSTSAGIGAGTGYAYGPATGTENANHTHAFSGSTGGISANHTHTLTTGGPSNNTTTGPTGGSDNNTAANASTSHNNMQPSVAIRFIIRT